MLYDTHAHPYLQKDKNKESVIKTFNKENPEGFLNSIGTNLETSLESINIAKKYSYVKATIGIHPCDIKNLNLEGAIQKLENMYLENKDYIVGIGECGLDYYRIRPDEKYKPEFREKIKKLNKELQAIFFKAQLILAKKYNLPVIIHNRESKDDIFNILVENNFKNFIFHCYSEDLEYARKLLKFSPDAMLSFSGIVTFKNAKNIAKTAKNIPLKNILVETDSPYLTPAPHRGKQENEPAFTKYNLKKIIELRDEDSEIIEKQIFKNSLKIFGIKK